MKKFFLTLLMTFISVNAFTYISGSEDIGATLVTPDKKVFLKLSCTERNPQDNSCLKTMILTNIQEYMYVGHLVEAQVSGSDGDKVIKQYLQRVNNHVENAHTSAGYLATRAAVDGFRAMTNTPLGDLKVATVMYVLVPGLGSIVIDAVKSPFVYLSYLAQSNVKKVMKKPIAVALFDHSQVGNIETVSLEDMHEILYAIAFSDDTY